MKLITFQTKKAWDILQEKGILTANPSCIDLQKYSVPYDWIVNAMKEQKILPKNISSNLQHMHEVLNTDF